MGKCILAGCKSERKSRGTAGQVCYRVLRLCGQDGPGGLSEDLHWGPSLAPTAPTSQCRQETWEAGVASEQGYRAGPPCTTLPVRSRAPVLVLSLPDSWEAAGTSQAPASPSGDALLSSVPLTASTPLAHTLKLPPCGSFYTLSLLSHRLPC